MALATICACSEGVTSTWTFSVRRSSASLRCPSRMHSLYGVVWTCQAKAGAVFIARTRGRRSGLQAVLGVAVVEDEAPKGLRIPCLSRNHLDQGAVLTMIGRLV